MEEREGNKVRGDEGRETKRGEGKGVKGSLLLIFTLWLGRGRGWIFVGVGGVCGRGEGKKRGRDVLSESLRGNR